jgi:hypothetical protein
VAVAKEDEGYRAADAAGNTAQEWRVFSSGKGNWELITIARLLLGAEFPRSMVDQSTLIEMPLNRNGDRIE